MHVGNGGVRNPGAGLKYIQSGRDELPQLVPVIRKVPEWSVRKKNEYCNACEKQKRR